MAYRTSRNHPSRRTNPGHLSGPGARIGLAALVVVGVLGFAGAAGQTAAATPTLVAASTTSASSGVVVQTPVATVSIAPAQYLALALDFIEQQSLRRADVDWATIRATAEARGATAQSVAATYPIITDTLKVLNDPHASFRPPARSTEITQGQANGYGFLASWPQRIVVSLASGGPAATAGLRLGDRIDQIEGRAPTGSKQVVAIPTSTKTKDTLRLTVSRKVTVGGAVKTRRLAVVIRKGSVSLVSTPEQDPATVKTVGERIGYLDLPGILGTPDDQQRYAQAAHAAIRATSQSPRCGWIVDVRRNRGGWVYPVLAAAAPLVPIDSTGVLMGKFDAAGVTEQWMYRNGEIVVNRPGANPREYPVFTVASPFGPIPLAEPTPVAVLISGLSASAGEALVLSFRHRPSVRTFGQRTLGLTTFNAVGPLPDGALILVSNAAMVDSRGTRQEGPVEPDQPVEPDWNHVGDAADPILTAARTWLESQPTCR